MSWSMQRVKEAHESAQRTTELYLKHANLWDPIMARVEDLTGYAYGEYGGGLCLYVNGDLKKLGDVWRQLRELGYKCMFEPPTDEKVTEKTFKFTHTVDGLIISEVTLKFTSTVCKQVIVGYETKEVPVYELRCGAEIPPDEIVAVADAMGEDLGDVPLI